MLQALMSEVAERLVDKGIKPPIFYAGNMDGQEQYREYQDNLLKNRSTKFGGIYSPTREM
jgi:uncharacterized phosphosugar-binding protein